MPSAYAKGLELLVKLPSYLKPLEPLEHDLIMVDHHRLSPHQVMVQLWEAKLCQLTHLTSVIGCWQQWGKWKTLTGHKMQSHTEVSATHLFSWKEGDSLGAKNTGIKDPIQAIIRRKRAGLGI
jgi:hypothetical protein